MRRQCLDRSLPLELQVVVDLPHREQMLVWLEHWLVRLRRERPKLVTVVSAKSFPNPHDVLM